MSGPPRLLEDCLNEARALAASGDVIEAGRYLRNLETRFPESSELQFLLGACYAKIDRMDLAQTAWRKAVDLAPGNYRAKAWLARLEHRDPTTYELLEETSSGALSGDLDACWDPTA